MPGTDGDFGFGEQELGELERAEVAVGLGNFGPDEHGGLGRRRPASRLVEAFDEHVAAAAVGVADLRDALLRPFERGDGRDLDGREGAVIEVALEAGEGGDELLVADHESDAPAGHVVALRQREELDRDIFGAGNLHDAGRLVAVEGDVGVGEVLDEIEAVLAGKLDEAREERAARRIRWSGSRGS